MGGQARLSSFVRRDLVNGTRNPQDEQERDWLANRRVTDSVAAQGLPPLQLSLERQERDQKVARRRRAGELAHAGVSSAIAKHDAGLLPAPIPNAWGGANSLPSRPIFNARDGANSLLSKPTPPAPQPSSSQRPVYQQPHNKTPNDPRSAYSMCNGPEPQREARFESPRVDRQPRRDAGSAATPNTINSRLGLADKPFDTSSSLAEQKSHNKSSSDRQSVYSMSKGPEPQREARFESPRVVGQPRGDSGSAASPNVINSRSGPTDKPINTSSSVVEPAQVGSVQKINAVSKGQLLTPSRSGGVSRDSAFPEDTTDYFYCSECKLPRSMFFDAHGVCLYCTDDGAGFHWASEKKFCIPGKHSTIRPHFVDPKTRSENYDVCRQHQRRVDPPKSSDSVTEPATTKPVVVSDFQDASTGGVDLQDESEDGGVKVEDMDSVGKMDVVEVSSDNNDSSSSDGDEMDVSEHGGAVLDDDEFDWVDAAMVDANGAMDGEEMPQNLQAAQEQAMKEASERRQQADATEQTFRAEAIEQHNQLARLVANLEKPSEDPFAKPLVEVLTYYDSYVRDNYPLEVEAHGCNRKPMGALVTAPDGQTQLPSLEDVLQIQPGDDNWATDKLIDFFLDRLVQKAGLPDKVIVASPAMVHLIANKEIKDEEVPEYFDEVLTKNRAGLSSGEPDFSFLIFAESDIDVDRVPDDIHVVYNPSRNHWIHAQFLVDRAKCTGEILLRNSINHGGRAIGHAYQRTLHDLPMLARVFSQHPHLGIQDIVWSDVKQVQCPQQANSNDCGFFAMESLRRVVRKENMYLPSTHGEQVRFGKKLRWRCLAELRRVLDFDELEEPSFAPQTSRGGSSMPNRRPKSPSRPPSKSPPPAPPVSQDNTAKFWTIRSEICDFLLEKEAAAEMPGIDVSASLEDIFNGTREAIPRYTDIAKLPCDVKDMIEKVLESTPETFEQVALFTGTTEYKLRHGFGRVVDSHTVNTLLSVKTPARPSSDNIGRHIHLMIPVMRSSDAYYNNSRLAQLQGRAEDLVKAYHLRFGASPSLPTEVQSGQEIVDRLGQDKEERLWLPHVREPGSSNNPFGNDLDATLADQLDMVNHFAESQDFKINITFIANGWDGMTTDNSSWGALSSRYDHMNLQLAIVTIMLPECKIDHGYTERVERHTLSWHHFDVAFLGLLYDGMPANGNSLHLCTQDVAKRVLSEVIQNQSGHAPLQTLSCSDCLTKGIFADEQDFWCWPGSEDSKSVDGLENFYRHAQCLLIMSLIRHYKTDYQVLMWGRDDETLTRRLGQGALTYLADFNILAHMLTRAAPRNCFEIPVEGAKQCELCHCTDTVFVRGNTNALALRCVTCLAADPYDEDGNTTDGSDISDDERHECPICQQQFTFIDHFARHVSSHGIKKPFICGFPNCGKGFRDRKSLTEHRNNVHSGVKPYACDYPHCDWAFQTPSQLRRHKRTHSEVHRYFCDFLGCGKGYRTERELTRHKTSHDEKIPLACDVEDCGERFMTKRGLKRHARTHIHTKTHECDACKASFDTELDMLDHRKGHAVDLTCQVADCGRYKKFPFNCPAQLEKHYREVHHMEGNIPAVRRLEVMKEDRRKQAVKHVCESPGCGKQYVSWYKMLACKKSHTQDLTCQMSHCRRYRTQRFSNEQGLYDHYRLVHKIQNKSDAPAIRMLSISERLLLQQDRQVDEHEHEDRSIGQDENQGEDESPVTADKDLTCQIPTCRRYQNFEFRNPDSLYVHYRDFHGIRYKRDMPFVGSPKIKFRKARQDRKADQDQKLREHRSDEEGEERRIQDAGRVEGAVSKRTSSAAGFQSSTEKVKKTRGDESVPQHNLRSRKVKK